MRVLHVIPSISPLRGGPSLAIREMCRGLEQRGVVAHVATTNDDGPGLLHVPLGRPIDDEGFTVWYFPRQTRFYTASWPLTTWLCRNVKEYDLLHIHCLFSYAALPAAYCAIRHRVPYVVRPLGTLTRWGMEKRRPRLKTLSFHLIERHILSRASCIHYTSEQERLEARAIGVEKSSMVVPLGIDLAPYSGLPPADALYRAYPGLAGRFVVLFLSRLDPKKGLDLLLPAFSQLHKADPRPVLVLAGDGPRDYVAHLHREAERLGIDRDIVWAGFLGGEQKLAALSAADLFVLPSYSENFGIAVVEAMAAGVPVVISDQVALCHEVRTAGAGLVTPRTAEAVASAMERLARDSDFRRSAGLNARRLAQEVFSRESMSGRLLEMYASALGARKGESAV